MLSNNSSPVLPNVSLATSMVTIEPLPSSSSIVPETCLKEVLLCELSPLRFHLTNAIKEKNGKGIILISCLLERLVLTKVKVINILMINILFPIVLIIGFKHSVFLLVF